jgi:cell division protein FtsB
LLLSLQYCRSSTDGFLITMRRLLLILVSLLGLIQYQLWFGVNSLPESLKLRDQISLQQASNDKLDDRNQILREEIIDLRSGTEALEERARNELGMVKKGETFFRVVGGKRTSQVLSH